MEIENQQASQKNKSYFIGDHALRFRRDNMEIHETFKKGLCTSNILMIIYTL